MARKKKKTKPDIDTLDAMVEEATVDACGDGEQLYELPYKSTPRRRHRRSIPAAGVPPQDR